MFKFLVLLSLFVGFVRAEAGPERKFTRCRHVISPTGDILVFPDSKGAITRVFQQHDFSSRLFFPSEDDIPRVPTVEETRALLFHTLYQRALRRLDELGSKYEVITTKMYEAPYNVMIKIKRLKGPQEGRDRVEELDRLGLTLTYVPADEVFSSLQAYYYEAEARVAVVKFDDLFEPKKIALWHEVRHGWRALRSRLGRDSLYDGISMGQDIFALEELAEYAHTLRASAISMRDADAKDRPAIFSKFVGFLSPIETRANTVAMKLTHATRVMKENPSVVTFGFLNQKGTPLQEEPWQRKVLWAIMPTPKGPLLLRLNDPKFRELYLRREAATSTEETANIQRQMVDLLELRLDKMRTLFLPLQQKYLELHGTLVCKGACTDTALAMLQILGIYYPVDSSHEPVNTSISFNEAMLPDILRLTGELKQMARRLDRP